MTIMDNSACGCSRALSGEDDLTSRKSLLSELAAENNGEVPLSHITCRNICRNDYFEALINDSLTTEHILLATDTTFSSALPLLMIRLERRVQAEGQTSPELLEWLNAFWARIHASRVLKLRLALLIRSGAFQELWKIDFRFNPYCYSCAICERDLYISRSALARQNSTASTLVSEATSIDVLMNNYTARANFMLKHLFDPKFGLALSLPETKRCKNPDSFVASAAVNNVVNRIKCTRQEAVDLLNIAKRDGIIQICKGIKGIRWFRNSKFNAMVDNSLDFADNNVIWIFTGFAGQVPDNPQQNWIQYSVYCDITDMQSIDFWSKTIFAIDPTKGYSFDARAITHPMTPHLSDTLPAIDKIDNSKWKCDCYFSAEKHMADYFSINSQQLSSRNPEDRSIVSGAPIIKTVFNSAARPYVLSLREPSINTSFIDSDSEYYVEADPQVIVKTGDNLLQDMMSQLMFRLFNSLWMRSRLKFFPNSIYFPFIVTYDVFPTDTKKGFIQAVPGVKSLKDYDWDSWYDKYHSDTERILTMVNTAAGSTIGAYIIGARDRHWDNILIKDDSAMFHIDFGFLLGNEPPIDGPRFTISPAMENCFRKLGEWDHFVELCCDAFRSLRQFMPHLIRTAQVCFRRAGFDEKTIDDYMRGPHVFDEKVSVEEAVAHMRKKLELSSTDLKNVFKQYSHANIDPVFYKLLEKKFPPAVLAMKMVDHSRDMKTMASTNNTDSSLKKISSLRPSFTAKK